jgi:hypothetical protein
VKNIEIQKESFGAGVVKRENLLINKIKKKKKKAIKSGILITHKSALIVPYPIQFCTG